MRWAEAPESVRDWVDTRLGSRVVTATDERGGFSPGPAGRLRCADGSRAFVKAVGAELNPDSPSHHRREARIMTALPSSPSLPRLLDVYDDGVWVALLYTEVEGQSPGVPWRADDLARIIVALDALHEMLTPCPALDVETAAESFTDEFCGWRKLAATDPPPVLDEWSVRHLDRLAELESTWPLACDGDTLLHTDLRADNTLMTDGAVVFVDWSHACRGAPWFDLACWAPSVAMQGGPDPESLFARSGAAAHIDADRVTAVVAAIAGYFTYAPTQPPPPGLPTLRAFQAAQGVEARAWLQERTGWE
jgi:aminoglycoside phosphotransferase (APT) family kinase protein